MLVLLGVAVVVGIGFLLHLACVSERDAALVTLNLPLALIGGVVGVFVSGGGLSVASLIGFITVFAIATRNGIMLVSHIRHLQAEEGVTALREAVFRGVVCVAQRSLFSDHAHEERGSSGTTMALPADGWHLSTQVAAFLITALACVWLDPVMGIVGSVVVFVWAYGLLRATGGILLDRTPESSDLPDEIRRAVEGDGTRCRSSPANRHRRAGQQPPRDSGKTIRIGARTSRGPGTTEVPRGCRFGGWRGCDAQTFPG